MVRKENTGKASELFKIFPCACLPVGRVKSLCENSAFSFLCGEKNTRFLTSFGMTAFWEGKRNTRFLATLEIVDCSDSRLLTVDC